MGQRTEIGSSCRREGVPLGGGMASPGRRLCAVLGCSSCLLHVELSMSLISSLLLESREKCGLPMHSTGRASAQWGMCSGLVCG